ncbi:hypothetical protein CHS0354_009974 [Potamilus streckersoni]|uniref:Uncharacterized protein n=1 Tax=Potamilus streckersoni TaxID=2493646 RepID=A0AAE0W9P1_9BIVA|nr:hypothetical protein CHS0354_009974 [Potamilus streckersoni]
MDNPEIQKKNLLSLSNRYSRFKDMGTEWCANHLIHRRQTAEDVTEMDVPLEAGKAAVVSDLGTLNGERDPTDQSSMDKRRLTSSKTAWLEKTAGCLMCHVCA